MKKIIFLGFFIFLFLLTNILFAEKKIPYKVKAEQFLSTLLKGKVEKAYDDIFKGTLLEQKTQQVVFIKKQTSIATSVYGKLLGYEFIKQQNYGNSIVRLVYIIKTEMHPLTFEFYFYKPKTKWILSNISFNDQFNLLADK